MIGPPAQGTLPELMTLLRAGCLSSHHDEVVSLFRLADPGTAQIPGPDGDTLPTPQRPPLSGDSGVIVHLMELHPELLAIPLNSYGRVAGRWNPIGNCSLSARWCVFPVRIGGIPPILERLKLPELRDPSHYKPVVTDNTTDMTPVNQRWLDDVNRFGAVQTRRSWETSPGACPRSRNSRSGPRTDFARRSLLAIRIDQPRSADTKPRRRRCSNVGRRPAFASAD